MRNTLQELLFETDTLNSFHYDLSDPLNDAFETLPSVIQAALLQQSRVILMANNPSITTETLQNLLRPTDILVLFNDFIHADFLAGHPIASMIPKLLFFRQNGDSKLHFGLPPRSNKLRAIEQMAKQAPLGFLLGNTPCQFPTPADDPRPQDDPITDARVLTVPLELQSRLADARYCRVLSEHHSVVADYPSFAHIHTSAPTSGFLLYRLLLAARQQVQRLQPASESFEILMLGFNDEDKTGYFWEGHNWSFERQELDSPVAKVTIIRQY